MVALIRSLLTLVMCPAGALSVSVRLQVSPSATACCVVLVGKYVALAVR